MAWSSWNSIYKREEKSPLDRYKNRNRLLKTFGANGPKVYDLLDGTASAEEVQKATGMERGQFAVIMDFILSNSLVAKSGESEGRKLTLKPEGPADEGGEGESGDAIGGEGEGIIGDIEGGDEGKGSHGGGEEREGYPRSKAGRANEGSGSIEGGAPRLGRKRSIADEVEAAISKGSELGGTPESLSPLEKLIWDKYGQPGVQVYNLIDGEKTAEEILNETGLSESKLVEILEFMNEQGIIKLEKPPESKKSPAPPRQPPAISPEQMSSEKGPPTAEVGFTPMVEPNSSPETKAAPAPQPSKFTPPPGATEAEINPEAVPVDVPLPKQLSILQKIKRRLVLMKFGGAGADLAKRADGTKDFVDIAIETRQPFSNLDIVFGELGKNSLMAFKQLTRNEIQHRYGDDGYAVYKRFGRDGLLIYQLIGKESSIRDIVTVARVPPEKAAEIILFVHKVLGLDMSIDRDMVYRYLQA